MVTADPCHCDKYVHSHHVASMFLLRTAISYVANVVCPSDWLPLLRWALLQAPIISCLPSAARVRRYRSHEWTGMRRGKMGAWRSSCHRSSSRTASCAPCCRYGRFRSDTTRERVHHPRPCSHRPRLAETGLAGCSASLHFYNMYDPRPFF